MKVNPDNYIVIQGWMVTELGLKGNDLLVYAIIYGFSQDEESIFYGSRQYLADWCCSTVRGIQNNLNHLIELGLIEQVEVKAGAYVKYKANRQKLTCEQSSLPPVNRVHTPIQQSSLNNIVNNKIVSKDTVVGKQANEFTFGVPIVKKVKSSNDIELDNAFVLVDDYTNNAELNSKLKELFSNRKRQCGNNRQHFYASTCKHYLDELSKVKDQLGAVNLSLQYNNTFKVMEPNVYPNQKQWHPDTNISTQTKSCDNDIALDDKGKPITF